MQVNLLNNILQNAGAVKSGGISPSGGNFTDIFGKMLESVNQSAVQNNDADNTIGSSLSSGSVSMSGLSSSDGNFASEFGDLINNIKETEAVANAENQKILTGESDDIHSAMIASQKAQLAVDLAVAVRDKVITAYNDVMNMQV